MRIDPGLWQQIPPPARYTAVADDASQTGLEYWRRCRKAVVESA